MTWIPTREGALARMEEFASRADAYGEIRNFVGESGEAASVSCLSPYIRTRLLTEEEITNQILSVHGSSAADTFLQEIAWRTYWKGWLEMRPAVWDHYLETLGELEKTACYQSAVSGDTGIDCFDHWVEELAESGYLHNHARMWFASIWIFTLKLPWQLGADFFLTHLLDADPASNTLSWRWVAGLHTPGKHYLARASNIEKFTRGRFNPVGQLDESAEPLPPNRTLEIQHLELPPNPVTKGRTGHLMFSEDLAPAPAAIGKIHATAGFIPPMLETTPLVSKFLNGAVNDALNRMSGTRLDGDFSSSVSDWISSEKLEIVVVSLPTVGHTKDFLRARKLPIPLQPFVREWDCTLWPKATAGFFKLKKVLPKLHQSHARKAVLHGGGTTPASTTAPFP